VCAVLLVAGAVPAQAEPGPSLDDALDRLVTGLRSDGAEQRRLDLARAELTLRRVRGDRLRGEATPKDVAAALTRVRTARKARQAWVTPLFTALEEALGLKRLPDQQATLALHERVVAKQATLIGLLERYVRLDPDAGSLRGSLELMRGMLTHPGFDPSTGHQFLADYEVSLDAARARLEHDVDASWAALLGRTEAAARSGPAWAAGRLAEVAAAVRNSERNLATADEVLAARIEAITTLRQFEGTADLALDQARRRAPVRRKEFQRGMVTLRRAADVLAGRDPARAASLRERLAAYGAQGAAGVQASGELSDGFRDDVAWAAGDLRRAERPSGDDDLDAAGAVPFQPRPGGDNGGSDGLSPRTPAPGARPTALIPPPRREDTPGGRAQAAPVETALALALAPAPLGVPRGDPWAPATDEVTDGITERLSWAAPDPFGELPWPGPVLTGFGVGLETRAWP
jgi:hypothetical protein